MLDANTRGSIQRIETLVRDLLEIQDAGRTIPQDADLTDLGLTSEGMINLVLAIEAEFDITIPGSKFVPANFRSIEKVAALVGELAVRRAA